MEATMSQSQPKLSRRVVFAGAGTAGALAAVAAVLPQVQPAPKKVAQVRPDVDKGGYQETQHVLHYYRTARV
jgi:acetyl esterase/lipase